MTYNFDPEQWLQNEIDALKHRRRLGEIDDAGFVTALSALEKRYDHMIERLDGTYRIPE